MPAFPKEWAEFAIDETVGIFKETADVIVQGEAEYIRAGEPQGVVATLNLAAARQTCRRFARETDSINAGASARLARVCRPYLEDIGEWPGEPSFAAPQFQGGQCAGKLYTFQVRPNAGGLDCFGTAWGPIGGFRGISLVGGGRLEVLSGTPPSGSGVQEWRGTGCGGSTWAEDGFSVLGVFPEDGGPDDCGSLPPEYEPPPPITDPLPPTTVPTPGIDIDVDVDIDPDGGITISFDVDGDITLSPPGNPNDDDEFSDPLGPKFPGDKGTPGTSVPVGEGGNANGEAPPGSVLVGVEVAVTQAIAPANVQNLPEYTVYRAACYVYLGSGTSLDQQPEAATLISPQFFFAPDGSTKWSVYAGWGYNLLVTPYYREVQE